MIIVTRPINFCGNRKWSWAWTTATETGWTMKQMWEDCPPPKGGGPVSPRTPHEPAGPRGNRLRPGIQPGRPSAAGRRRRADTRRGPSNGSSGLRRKAEACAYHQYLLFVVPAPSQTPVHGQRTPSAPGPIGRAEPQPSTVRHTRLAPHTKVV